MPEFPEVADIKENNDGTITLTVEAVCEMVIRDDSVITHSLSKWETQSSRRQHNLHNYEPL